MAAMASISLNELGHHARPIDKSRSPAVEITNPSWVSGRVSLHHTVDSEVLASAQCFQTTLGTVLQFPGPAKP